MGFWGFGFYKPENGWRNIITMAFSDPIADYLTRVRNAQQAGHRIGRYSCLQVEESNHRDSSDQQGYILKYPFEDDVGEGGQGVIKVALKYDPITRKPVIRELGRISKPGLRKDAAKADGLPRIINGLGLAIVSTSRVA